MVKFPLLMNGTKVRTLEDLKKNFDLTSVLEYYINGQLLKWLKDHHCVQEAARVEAIENDSNIAEELCDIFGVSLNEEAKGVDMKFIERRIKKREELLQYGATKELLNNIDSVALTQADLEACIRDGKKHVYLVKGEFDVSELPEGIEFTKVYDPVVKEKSFAKTEEVFPGGISFEKYGELLSENSDKYMIEQTVFLLYDQPDCQRTLHLDRIDELRLKAKKLYDSHNYRKAFAVLNAIADDTQIEESKKAITFANLGMMYAFGKGTPPDFDQAKRWLMKAEEFGVQHSNGMLLKIIDCELKSGSRLSENNKPSINSLIRRYREMNPDCDVFLIGMFSSPNMEKAYNYYDLGFYDIAFKLAETDAKTKPDVYAKYDVGMMYAFGKGIPVDLEQAKYWLEKAVGIGKAVEELLGAVNAQLTINDLGWEQLMLS